ncbi:hypothetical protein [Sphingopyxis sp.]|uniref:hypothetical protein n=1 Tax=Sphingopyxis sp. TaxID=1908224 RepID=UPI003D6CE59C
MKRLILMALLAVPTAGWACPPLNGHPIAVAQRVEAFREQVIASKAIVYGVVERPITTREGSVGILHILHVYKGDLMPGQRLKMRYALPPSRCPIYAPKDYVFSQDRGTYGVVLIPEGADGDPLSLTGFQDAARVNFMISQGLIVSAQGIEPSPSDPVSPHFQ